MTPSLCLSPEPAPRPGVVRGGPPLANGAVAESPPQDSGRLMRLASAIMTWPRYNDVMNEAPFLSALHDDPADEASWLALADWLDEDGRSAQAELLRLHRAVRQGPAPDPARLDAKRK